MPTIYYSVDVEATSTNTTDGVLLSVGVVVVREYDYGLKCCETFYARVNQPGVIDHGAAEAKVWNPETLDWWLTQEAESPEAFGEVFNRHLVRHDHDVVARMLSEFVHETGGSERMCRVFVANPASYDWQWIDRLFCSAGIETPFSYRTLCLRSAAWGHKTTDLAKSIRTTKPLRPHHALDDAAAQAQDLINLWDEKTHIRDEVTA